ncbi:DNA mismatch repair protein MutS domain protein [Anaeromyxobacter sp. K]|uniref:MutS-related protein n=1 Tax=Anaeromyxobacter sp. (strain K) TaxID=447217 RepID=UPI00017BE180|nr:DNA mismatch repair protein MutS [Anaeromyxobacter sp. K]ACG73677.1 DNA mismatch repair protein MutS domain protein [Anaeromyxobacter sp. K]
MNDPSALLRARHAERTARVARLDRADAWVARARLAVAIAAVATAVLVFGTHALQVRWLALPAAAFVALVVVHDRVFHARDRARRAVAFHQAGLDRIEGRFAGHGTAGERFADPAHPYAEDLDLFGAGSLFELLCAARTRAGEDRLAAWLRAPADSAEVRARQAAVQELAPRLDLREDLAVLGEDVRAAVEPARLAAWGEAPRLLPAFVVPAALALALAAVATAWAWGAGYGPVPFLAALLAGWAFGRALRGTIAGVLGGVGRPAAELRVLALLLARLEREPFTGPRLLRLQEMLGVGSQGGGRASARIARLERLASRVEWAHNQAFAPVAFALQWTPLHAALVERWRAAHGGAVRGWLEAVADLEALSSLAGYAFEHPADAFPEVVDPGAEPRALLDGDAVRHPLLAAAVANDVRLGGDAPAVLLVSGSNMSGKSTYLRTVGVNVVLALAGAPVRAARLRLTPVQLGATLRIQDSLQAGKSRFYAEITRLKQLMDLAGGRFPLLFLLDEILHGTNSHDRRIGAEAVVRGLVARGALGLVTTHDLALTELAGQDGALGNAHFEDQVQGGEIAFDYRLRPGVVGHSNALALMRAVGLRV